MSIKNHGGVFGRNPSFGSVEVGSLTVAGNAVPDASTILVDGDIGSTVQGYDADTAKRDTAQTFTGTQTFSDLIATSSVAVNLTGNGQQVSTAKSFIRLSGNGAARSGCFLQNGTVDGQVLRIRGFTWSVTVINNPSGTQNVVFAGDAASATFGNLAGNVITMDLIWDSSGSGRWFELGRSTA